MQDCLHAGLVRQLKGGLLSGLGSWVAWEWVGCDRVAGPMCFSGRWRREVRIKKGSHRWQGETWYYGPCGKRMKQFPEVIKVTALVAFFKKGLFLGSQECRVALSPLGPVLHVLLLPKPWNDYDFTNAIHFSSQYLSRNVMHSVRREHFSFSPRMPVGDFFEERDTPEVLA